MSGDAIALIAFLGSSALIVVIWLAARRADRAGVQRLPELVRERLEKAEEQVIPPGESLKRAVEELETAQRLLDEVYSIGVWVKSDDSSDNRRKRQGLRETDWAVSGAQRAVAAARSQLQDARLDALESELRSLVARLEPLPDTIPDTMGDNPALDVNVRSMSDEVEKLRERVLALVAERSS